MMGPTGALRDRVHKPAFVEPTSFTPTLCTFRKP